MEVLKREFDQKKTQNLYQKISLIYDFWSWITERKALEKSLELAEIRDGEKVLEVACGTGISFINVVKRNPSGENIGLDLSPSMLKKAEKRLSKLKLANYKLLNGNALNLPFEDNSFDLLLNNFMLDLFPEELFEQVAAEFSRVLKPEGRAIVTIFSFGDKPYNKIWFWIAKYFPELLTGCRPIVFAPHLEKAGFEIVEIANISQNTFPSQVIKAVKNR